MTYDVALLPGDGIRPQAVHEALRMVEHHLVRPIDIVV